MVPVCEGHCFGGGGLREVVRVPRDRRAEGGIWPGHQGFGASVAPVPGGNASSFGGRGALRRGRGDLEGGGQGSQGARQSASPAPSGTPPASRRCGYQLSQLCFPNVRLGSRHPPNLRSRSELMTSSPSPLSTIQPLQRRPVCRPDTLSASRPPPLLPAPIRSRPSLTAVPQIPARSRTCRPQRPGGPRRR